MSDTEWLANLKAGDRVIVEGGISNRLYIREVERTTATTVILVGGSKYRRKGGRLIGGCDSWNSTYLREPTKELHTIAWRQMTLERLPRIAWHALTDEQLSGVQELLISLGVWKPTPTAAGGGAV